MATDPFSRIPKIAPQEAESTGAPGVAPGSTSAQAAPTSSPADITKGASSKSMLRNLQKYGVGLLLLAGAIWLVFSDDPQQSRKREVLPTNIDAKVQSNNANGLLEALKEDAAKAPTPPQTQPGQGPGLPNGSPANSGKGEVSANGVVPVSAPRSAGAVPTATSQSLAQPYPTPMQPSGGGLFGGPQGPDPATAQQQREAEIRASALEFIGSFTLANEGGAGSTQAHKPATNTAELADMLARRDAGQSTLTDVATRLAAANVQPTTAQRTRGSNEEFLANAASSAAPHVAVLQAPAAAMMLHQGTVVRSVLLSEISSHLPGDIQARVTSDVYDSITQHHVLIPKGSLLIGKYNHDVAVGQERLLVALTRLILPNGNWIALGGAQASSGNGQSGLRADVDNHFFKMFGSSFIIGAASMLMPGSRTEVQSTTSGAGTTTTGSVAGIALNETISTLMQRNKSIAPTLSTHVGDQFIFMVSQDLAIPPFRP